MAKIWVETTKMKATLQKLDKLEQTLQNLSEDVSRVRSNMAILKMAGNDALLSKIRDATNQLDRETTKTRAMYNGLEQIIALYTQTEQVNRDNLDANKNSIQGETQPNLELSAKEKSTWDKFVEEFQSEFGWSDLLKGSKYIGTIYNLISDIKKGTTLEDFANSSNKIYQFMTDAAKTFSNYKKIGNAVGTKKAMVWWAKNITGLKPLGRASSAKNPFTRFANNLTNKTSPFNAKLKNTIGDFKGANGVGKAVASWGTVAVTGVTNWFSNKEEQANSNGTMSNGRVIAETVTETVIDTVLTHGTGIVVGAAVTTALGTAAAPGIIVVAASGLVIAGLNAGVKALTGKTTTEWISDTILDTGEAIGKAVGNAAKKVSNSIGNWFKRPSFA